MILYFPAWPSGRWLNGKNDRIIKNKFPSILFFFCLAWVRNLAKLLFFHFVVVHLSSSSLALLIIHADCLLDACLRLTPKRRLSVLFMPTRSRVLT